jgi:hypothetical protein
VDIETTKTGSYIHDPRHSDGKIKQSSDDVLSLLEAQEEAGDNFEITSCCFEYSFTMSDFQAGLSVELKGLIGAAHLCAVLHVLLLLDLLSQSSNLFGTYCGPSFKFVALKIVSLH